MFQPPVLGTTDGQDGELSFKQEYPFTVAEAFQVTGGGQTLINAESCLKARNNEFNGNGSLVVGVDPSRGGDRFAIIYRQGRKMYGQKAYKGAQCDSLGKNVAICKAILDNECPVAKKKPDMIWWYSALVTNQSLSARAFGAIYASCVRK